RGAFLRSGFGEQQRAVLEFEDREQQLRPDPDLFTWRTPTEPSGDHQVNDQKDVGFEDEHNPLSDTTDRLNNRAVNALEGRLYGPEQERTAKNDTVEAPTANPFGQGFDVDRHIWKFGHARGRPVYFRPSSTDGRPKGSGMPSFAGREDAGSC